jgi:hypothetical protein
MEGLSEIKLEEVRCRKITKGGSRCRLKCVEREESCRRHIKWDGECSICIEAGPNWQLKCGHRFHRMCFEKWKRKLYSEGKDATCPICRSIEIKTQKNKKRMDYVLLVLQRLFPFSNQMIE